MLLQTISALVTYLYITKISKKGLVEFQIKTLNLYITLSAQILKRFLSSNMFTNLELLKALDPTHFSQERSNSAIPLAVKFSLTSSKEML